ncbi:hypothetical protein CDAR_91331 [Caerostris darwini]|uniref:Uncharacterized protein n=1 Tax=Caerostris darwini TaxID=1538125 RepID=A0AAV4WTC4_9ARAC|nr:hypothetical protein CDAR_91331 [Caerostris darwini]
MAVYPRCKRSLPWMLEIRPGNDTNSSGTKVLPEDVGIEHLMPNKKEDGVEDDVYDLDWEKITARKKFNLNFM